MGKKKTGKMVAIAASAGAAVGAAYLAMGSAIFAGALSRRSINKQIENNEKNAADNEFYPLELDGKEWFYSKSPAKVSVVSPRGGNIHAEIIAADEPTDRWAIVVHGYTGSPDRMGLFGKHFSAMGFNCLFPHLCGHGESESNYVAMGWHDRQDVIGWINYIINENPNAKIVLFGLSMGAATVMMTTGETLPDNVVCAVEDCGYTSVWDECRVQLKEMFGLPAFPFLTSARSATKLHAGYDIKKASCVEQVSHSTTPTLFIHGDKDDFVPFWMHDMVYRAASCEKQRLVIPGAAHAQAACVNPELYWSTVEKFVEKYC